MEDNIITKISNALERYCIEHPIQSYFAYGIAGVVTGLLIRYFFNF